MKALESLLCEILVVINANQQNSAMNSTRIRDVTMKEISASLQTLKLKTEEDFDCKTAKIRLDSAIIELKLEEVEVQISIVKHLDSTFKGKVERGDWNTEGERIKAQNKHRNGHTCNERLQLGIELDRWRVECEGLVQ